MERHGSEHLSRPGPLIGGSPVDGPAKSKTTNLGWLKAYFYRVVINGYK